MPADERPDVDPNDAVRAVALGALLTAPADNPYRTWSKDKSPHLSSSRWSWPTMILRSLPVCATPR
jgi:hypothetical protein